MAWKLNRKGYNHAVSLIESEKINEGSWSAPNLSDFKDIEEYSLFHLAVDPDKDLETAGAYAYPYGKGGEVYTQALRSIRAYASGARGAEKNPEIFDAAGRLLDKIATITGKGIEDLEPATPTAVKDVFSIKSEDERLISGPVLIPNYRDCQAHAGEKPMAPEEIRDRMKTFYDFRVFDVKHRALKEGDFTSVAELVESWQLREAWNGYPAGTWMITARVTDDDVWRDVKSGYLRGFSVSAVSKDSAEKLFNAKEDSVVFKNVPLAHLEDPVICTISLTDKPCVFDAKIISIKEDDTVKEEKNVLKRIYELLSDHFSVKEEAVVEEEAKPTPEGPVLEDLLSKVNTTMDRLAELDEKLKEIAKTIEESGDETPETPETPEASEGEESGEEDELEEIETEVESTTKEEKPEKKSVPPDEGAIKETTFDLMGYLGRDPYGCSLPEKKDKR